MQPSPLPILTAPPPAQFSVILSQFHPGWTSKLAASGTAAVSMATESGVLLRLGSRQAAAPPPLGPPPLPSASQAPDMRRLWEEPALRRGAGDPLSIARARQAGRSTRVEGQGALGLGQFWCPAKRSHSEGLRTPPPQHPFCPLGRNLPNPWISLSPQWGNWGESPAGEGGHLAWLSIPKPTALCLLPRKEDLVGEGCCFPLYEEPQSSDPRDPVRTQAAVAVVDEEVRSQGPCGEVIHTAGPIGHVAHHHGFCPGEPAGGEAECTSRPAQPPHRGSCCGPPCLAPLAAPQWPRKVGSRPTSAQGLSCRGGGAGGWRKRPVVSLVLWGVLGVGVRRC